MSPLSVNKIYVQLLKWHCCIAVWSDYLQCCTSNILIITWTRSKLLLNSTFAWTKWGQYWDHLSYVVCGMLHSVCFMKWSLFLSPSPSEPLCRRSSCSSADLQHLTLFSRVVTGIFLYLLWTSAFQLNHSKWACSESSSQLWSSHALFWYSIVIKSLAILHPYPCTSSLILALNLPTFQ